MKKSLLVLCFFFSVNGFAQQFPTFKPLRYDEDYTFLKKDSSLNWYKKMKYTPLSKNQNTYLSYGGGMRFQYFYPKNEQWGDVPKDSDGYVLSRWLVHADLHIGHHFRTFVQLQSSLANSRPDASPVDDNPLEFHQAFFDIKAKLSGKADLTFRIGRQELLYGSQRIISVREGPNNRQSFDGLRLLYFSENSKVDLFYTNYVKAKKNIFDDGFNKNTKLWGVYLVKNKIPLIKNADFYYLGYQTKEAVYDDGSGKELRHSLGTRFWNKSGNWKYDFETLYQFGDFVDKKISAWTVSINTTYQFEKPTLKPEIGLKLEIVSGDKEYGDSKLGTFNPLFPRGAYFGLAPQIGPVNLIDVHPYLNLQFTNTIKFTIDCDIFWRNSSNDGLYGPNAALIYSGKNIQEKYIGSQFAGYLNYSPNDFLGFTAEFTWFNAGEFLKAAGTGKDILFPGITAEIIF